MLKIKDVTHSKITKHVLSGVNSGCSKLTNRHTAVGWSASLPPFDMERPLSSFLPLVLHKEYLTSRKHIQEKLISCYLCEDEDSF